MTTDDSSTVDSPQETVPPSTVDSPQRTEPSDNDRSVSHPQTVDLSSVLSELSGLPEKIALAVREATQPPKTPTPKTATLETKSTGDSNKGEAPAGSPGRAQGKTRHERFLDRWWNN